MAAIGKCHLRPVDRPQTQWLRGLGKFHCTAEVVVVGQGKSTVATLDCGSDQLVRQRSPVMERERRMGVKLGVHGRHQLCALQLPPGSLKITVTAPRESITSQ